MSILVPAPLPPLPPVERVNSALFVPGWERAERDRLDAGRCPEPGCGELPPNHRAGCARVRLPDPGAKRCRSCGYVRASLGCRLTCGSTS